MPSRKSIPVFALAGAAAAFLLNACATLPGPDSVTVLHEAPYCAGGKDRQALLLTDPAGLAEAWRRGMTGPVPAEPPSVDFSRNAVLFLADMERPTTGYGLRLVDKAATCTDGVARLRVDATVPDGIAAQVITRPCLFLSLPAGDYRRIEVVDRQGIPWIVLQRP